MAWRIYLVYKHNVFMFWKIPKYFKAHMKHKGITFILKLTISVTTTKYLPTIYRCALWETVNIGGRGKFWQFSVHNTLLLWHCGCSTDSQIIWNFQTHIFSLLVLFTITQKVCLVIWAIWRLIGKATEIRSKITVQYGSMLWEISSRH